MIGTTIYIYDTNRRHYKDDSGAKINTPNPRHYWRPYVITGETRGTWLIAVGAVNKKTMKVSGELGLFAYTETGMQDKLWHDVNYHRIVEAVRHADIATLRAVATIPTIDALLRGEDT